MDLNHIPVVAAHKATQNALLGHRHRTKDAGNSLCIYTDPEIAHIGLAGCRGACHENSCKNLYYSDATKLTAPSRIARTGGFVKIHVKEGTDKILGATIVSRHAGDIMNGISLAMGVGIGLREFAKIHYPYPTQGDAIKKAALACQKSLRSSMLDHVVLAFRKMRRGVATAT